MSLNAAEASTESIVAQARPDDLIYFPDGLVGCEEWKRFVLVVDDLEELPVALLQNVDDPTVGLMVTDPSLIVPGFAVSLSAEERASLDLDPTVAATQYCTLSVAPDGTITANLVGPLVVNPVTRRGLQLVIADSAYSTRHPVARIAGKGSDACSS